MPGRSNANNDVNAPLDIVIRNTCANVAITQIKVHNLQIEVQELRKELRALVRFLLRDDPIVASTISPDELATINHAYDKK